MKKFVNKFLLGGMIGCGFGPIILAIVYWILQKKGVLEMLSVNQVCIGILSLAALAFVAGGMNAIYKIERLPLMAAILIHGIVLYFSYLVTYLLNNWLKSGVFPFLVFTVIFVVGYLVIWAIIYCIIRKRAAKLTVLLKVKQEQVKQQ